MSLFPRHSYADGLACQFVSVFARLLFQDLVDIFGPQTQTCIINVIIVIIAQRLPAFSHHLPVCLCSSLSMMMPGFS